VNSRKGKGVPQGAAAAAATAHSLAMARRSSLLASLALASLFLGLATALSATSFLLRWSR